MADFAYLYWNQRTDAQRMAGSTPEQKKAITQRWKIWLDELAAKGKIKDLGFPLEFTGSTLGPQKRVTDGPHPEAKDVIGGISVITAQDLAEATELAKGCPILELGGRCEVRPIRPLVL